MPKQLTTNWKKVGQSGPTADGRFIKPEWIEQAAANYDAEKVYAALMWPEHIRWFGNYGKVVEIKAEREGDIVSLYARLRPGKRALQANDEEQKLYSSMELTENFADTGEFYLTGLGLTDSPASLGTQELSFSHQGVNHTPLVSGAVEFNLKTEEQDSEIPSWFIRAVKKFGINIPTNQGATPEPEEDAMNAEQFSEMMGEIKSIGERQAALEHKFSALNPAPDGEGPGTNTGATPDEGKLLFTAEIASAMKPVTDKLAEMETAFNAKVSDLTKRLEQVNPGTIIPETPQPADPGADFL